jgi:hypothetical protein
MLLETYVSESDRTYRVSLKIDQYDLQNLELSEFDKLVVADCNQKNSTISDRLLALELICRKIEEQNERFKNNSK